MTAPPASLVKFLKQNDRLFYYVKETARFLRHTVTVMDRKVWGVTQ